MIKVGYLGPEGTYSNQAAIQQFKDLDGEVEFVPLKSISACFETINEGSLDYTMVPFENSSNGQVVLTYDLFRDWFTRKEDDKPKFNVISEEFVPIHHNFITFSNDISKIKTIYSHPQVWTQCRKFLNKYELDNSIKIEKIDTSSTSKAVENLLSLTDDDKQTTAAIASSIASEKHNVPIKISNVEDFSGNTTRFLCLSNKPLPLKVKSTTQEKMRLLTFIIKNNDNFGSLCDILQVFKNNNLNLQTITTRPSINSAWRYVFFVEVWDGELFDNCLKELQPLVIDINVVGSFKRSKTFFDMIQQNPQSPV